MVNFPWIFRRTLWVRNADVHGDDQMVFHLLRGSCFGADASKAQDFSDSKPPYCQLLLTPFVVDDFGTPLIRASHPSPVGNRLHGSDLDHVTPKAPMISVPVMHIKPGDPWRPARQDTRREEIAIARVFGNHVFVER